MTYRAKKQGLYDPSYEKDSCGIGFIAHIKNEPSRRIVEDGLSILCSVTHRGAVGADPKASDGVGILTRIPHAFFASQLGQTLKPQDYGIIMAFCHEKKQRALRAAVEKAVRDCGQHILTWRVVPTEHKVLGESLKKDAPACLQAFIKKNSQTHPTEQDFERILYIIRKKCEQQLNEQDPLFYIASSSCRTLVYKGMVMADDLPHFFPDLLDDNFTSSIALVHQRFSTNTFPSWSLAQPFRFLCHNGEINTLRGNVNWMRAREHQLEGSLLHKEDAASMRPVISDYCSDSSALDEALEFMIHGGYTLPHAMMTLIPEAWQNADTMPTDKRAFYAYHAAKMEPWDGPAAVAFTDGKHIGAILDRNGLRPARYIITKDDHVILASEAGVLANIPDDTIRQKWRLQPGKMLLIDLENKQLIDDALIKTQLSSQQDWQQALQHNAIPLRTILPKKPNTSKETPADQLLARQRHFGYTREDITFYLEPMMDSSSEPIGSMGVDTPPPVLSQQPLSLFSAFKQRFAQVTNPAIDPLREHLVMSLQTHLGARLPLFHAADNPDKKPYIVADSPCLGTSAIAALRQSASSNGSVRYPQCVTLDSCYDSQTQSLQQALGNLQEQAWQASRQADSLLIIISDKQASASRVPIPSLLAVSAVHHHLIERSTRMGVALIAESGDAREPHHFAVLAGYGADAIHPWLALDTVASLSATRDDLDSLRAQDNYLKACDKALLKIMSKMGISTFQSYCGAQIFDSLGLSHSLIDRYFRGTAAPIDGLTLSDIEDDLKARLARIENVEPTASSSLTSLDVGGAYAVRVGGESHAWTTHSVAALQHAVRNNLPDTYQEFAKSVNEPSPHLLTIRNMLEPIAAGEPLPLEKVESAEDIVKRFATGAMSFGAISHEAHTNLAFAMNRIAGKSNTGEGGEDEARFAPLDNGDSARSSIKQVASGRFGVHASYLANADDIQIKICQGAKPGEGGQLPGHKVDSVIAKIRCSTPGVGLISPPPHHDIYSIEDIAQLIFDLKNVNPRARISVKLASVVGVGIVATGVAKARSDHITIAGYEGGTGASPLTSIKHTGLPWEIGLAETQQTLVLNRLRERVVLQVDGGLRSGLDVIVAALLGADEFGFATAPLIASGCLMMRKCHLNTCPVGIATQNPVLRKRFHGTPEHVINYFFFVAEEVRGWLSRLGCPTMQDIIGQSDKLALRHIGDHPLAHRCNKLDVGPLLHRIKTEHDDKLHHNSHQQHPISAIIDRKLIEKSRATLDSQGKEKTRLRVDVGNTDRSLATMLSGEVAKRYGHAGLADDSIIIDAHGCAGQSCGAFLAAGISLNLEGEGNDYLGKGLSGGRLAVFPPRTSTRPTQHNVIVGNTVLYGAINGTCCIAGVAGERFAVRNSGAIATVEGVGDHACEYMTGGIVVVLGDYGHNLAAGMSGGIAYVFDPDDAIQKRCNQDMVDIEPYRQWQKNTRELTPSNQDIDMHALSANMLQDDLWRLYTLLQLHHRYTASAYSKTLLDQWRKICTQFVKIVPRDLRRALQSTPLSTAPRQWAKSPAS